MAAKCNDSKRRDHKGRILKTGESQRADLTYQYRYSDSRGVRRYIYAHDLHTLREEEKQIQLRLTMGIDYAKGNITVLDLAKKYTELKELGVKRNTRLWPPYEERDRTKEDPRPEDERCEAMVC